MSATFYQEYTNHYFIEHVRRPNSHVMHHRHAHEDYEFYYIVDGDRSMFIHNAVLTLTKGSLLVIRPNVLHRSFDGQCPDHDRILVEIKRSFFDHWLVPTKTDTLFDLFINPYTLFQLDTEKQKAFEAMFKRYIRNKKNSSEELHTILFLMEMFQLLHSCEAAEMTADQTHHLYAHRRISTVIQYVCDHYSENIGLNTVASDFFISPEHLSRSFKKVTGFTFNEYLSSLRIMEATHLLKTTSLTIEAISRKVGYQSNTHFGRAFKSRQGISPSAYRKKVKPE